MNHIEFLRFLRKGDKSFFDVSVDAQKTFLGSLPVPKSDIERSFLQYKCLMFFTSSWKKIVLSIVSILLFFLALLFLLINRWFIRRDKHCDAISDLGNMREIIPDDLSEKYEITYNQRPSIGMLKIADVWLLIKIFFRFFPHGFFCLKNAIKIAQYRRLIEAYTPNAIIAHSEYSFSSSLLTSYCESLGVKHINIMHGEKFYNITDSFFRFSECYVWSSFYKELFIMLKAEENQFVVYSPHSLTIDTEANYNKDSYADYKYYLPPISEAEIKSIVESLLFIKEKGCTVKYRLHPRYYEKDLVEKYVDKAEIEDPFKVSIIESVSSCQYAIGSYSTVLAQAYFSGKGVVMDDVTYYKQYVKLDELQYWLIKTNCPRLSELQNS